MSKNALKITESEGGWLTKI